MGTYRKSRSGGKRGSHDQRGFQFLEVKKNQFEREKRKNQDMSEAISNKNLEIKKAQKKIQHQEETIWQLQHELENAHLEIRRLEGVVETQRGIIEDMTDGW